MIPRLLRSSALVAVFAAVAFGARPASADRVPLKTGETIVGKVVMERSNELVLVVEDYVSGGLREIAWDAVTDDAAAALREAGGFGGIADQLVKGEAIRFRLNTGTGELRGVVEKTEGGFLHVRNASMKEPQKIALADVVGREPIELEPQEVKPIADVFEDMRNQIAPDDARKWYRLGLFGERIGAYEQAKECFETAASDEGYLQRELAKAAAQRMTLLIADKSSLDELRELRMQLGANLWKRVREAKDTFLSRHPDASEAVKKKLEDLGKEFEKRRTLYFAGQSALLFEKTCRRAIDLKVRPRDAVFNDIQGWIRKDALEQTWDEMLKQFQLRDPAVTLEEVKAFFDARPKKGNTWRRVSYESGSFLIEPAKIKPPSGQPKPPAGAKKGGNQGPQVSIEIPKPPTRDTWWAAAPGEVRAKFWWATLVEKSGIFEVQTKRDRVACVKCDGAGKLTKLLSGGSSLEYLCERCGGAQYDQIVVYR